MKEIKVSIFTPVYNAEKYLEKCLDSILSQTISEFELFIYDDGSTDNSYEICEKYAKQDNRIHLSQGKNATSVYAMNNFIEKAEGKYIAFVDNDDYLDDNYLEKLYNEAERTEADGAVGSYTFVDSENNILPWYTPELKKGELLTGREACERFLTSFDIEGFRWNKLYNKSVFIQSGVRFRKHFPADIPIEFDLLLNSDKIVMVPCKGYYYRQSGSSEVATVNINKLLGFLETFSDIRERAWKKGMYKEAQYYYSFRCINILFDAIKSKESYKREEWIQICEKCRWYNIFKEPFWKILKILLPYKNKRDGFLKFLIKTIVVRYYF